ncbi:hypothetical protein BSKO_08894 [Bryopsis sp. KO-2023]|nr:hypothetical protein BSKO_08894 [Bryopsis sp. KO-2023]
MDRPDIPPEPGVENQPLPQPADQQQANPPSPTIPIADPKRKPTDEPDDSREEKKPRLLAPDTEQQGNAENVPAEDDGGKAQTSQDVCKQSDPVAIDANFPSGYCPDRFSEELAQILDRNGGVGGPEHVARLEGLMHHEQRLKHRWTLLTVVEVSAVECQRILVLGNGLQTLERWLVEAREANKPQFLEKIIACLSVLPMDLNSLKKGTIGKTVGMLRRNEFVEVKKAAIALVGKWKSMVDKTIKDSNSGAGKKGAAKRKAQSSQGDTGKGGDGKSQKAAKIPTVGTLVAVDDSEMFNSTRRPAKKAPKKRVPKGQKIIQRGESASAIARTLVEDSVRRAHERRSPKTDEIKTEEKGPSQSTTTAKQTNPTSGEATPQPPPSQTQASDQTGPSPQPAPSDAEKPESINQTPPPNEDVTAVKSESNDVRGVVLPVANETPAQAPSGDQKLVEESGRTGTVESAPIKTEEKPVVDPMAVDRVPEDASQKKMEDAGVSDNPEVKKEEEEEERRAGPVSASASKDLPKAPAASPFQASAPANISNPMMPVFGAAPSKSKIPQPRSRRVGNYGGLGLGAGGLGQGPNRLNSPILPPRPLGGPRGAAAAKAAAAAASQRIPSPDRSLPRKVKAKTVSWVADNKLASTRWFRKDDPPEKVKRDSFYTTEELLAQERMKAARQSPFNSAARHEYYQEQEALRTSKKHEMQERIQTMRRKVAWQKPPEIGLSPDWKVAFGEGSEEKFIQAQRDERVVGMRSSRNTIVPSTPIEPIPEPASSAKPKIIPYEVTETKRAPPQQAAPSQPQVPQPTANVGRMPGENNMAGAQSNRGGMQPMVHLPGMGQNVTVVQSSFVNPGHQGLVQAHGQPPQTLVLVQSGVQGEGQLLVPGGSTQVTMPQQQVMLAGQFMQAPPNSGLEGVRPQAMMHQMVGPASTTGLPSQHIQIRQQIVSVPTIIHQAQHPQNMTQHNVMPQGHIIQNSWSDPSSQNS